VHDYIWGYESILTTLVYRDLFPSTRLSTHFELNFNCTSRAECHYLHTAQHCFGMGGACTEQALLPWGRGCSPPPPNASMTSTVYTGRGDACLADSFTASNCAGALLSQQTRWLGNSSINDVYPQPVRVAGTGMFEAQFHPFVQKTEQLRVWMWDPLRDFTLDYDSAVTLKGVDLYRFRPSASIFAGTDPRFTRHPLRRGLLDLNQVPRVKYGLESQIFGSQPLFLDADPSLAAAFTCTNCGAPSVQAHGSFLDVEPTTGKVLSARARAQVNVRVGDPAVYGPVFWWGTPLVDFILPVVRIAVSGGRRRRRRPCVAVVRRRRHLRTAQPGRAHSDCAAAACRPPLTFCCSTPTPPPRRYGSRTTLS
jgi:hypothetical protein